jgi:SAM-dependent methyltransferase
MADASFDHAYAIESTEHMADKEGLFLEVARTLKPGGRFVVCAWLSEDRPSRWRVRHLLEPICREGRLPGMGTRGEYEAWAAAAGPETHPLRGRQPPGPPHLVDRHPPRARQARHHQPLPPLPHQPRQAAPPVRFEPPPPHPRLPHRRMRYGVFTFALRR